MLGPTAAEPGPALKVGHYPGAEGEDGGKQQQGLVVAAEDAAAEAEMDKLAIVEHGVMAEEKDHRVLADEVDDGDARQAEQDEQAREAAKDSGDVGHGDEWIAGESVVAHRVGTIVKNGVAGHKSGDKEGGEAQEVEPWGTVDEEVPKAAQLEEEDAHEDVV